MPSAGARPDPRPLLTGTPTTRMLKLPSFRPAGVSDDEKSSSLTGFEFSRTPLNPFLCWREAQRSFQPAAPFRQQGVLGGRGGRVAGSCWKLVEVMVEAHTITMRDRNLDVGPSVTTRIFPLANSRSMASVSAFLFSL